MEVKNQNYTKIVLFIKPLTGQLTEYLREQHLCQLRNSNDGSLFHGLLQISIRYHGSKVLVGGIHPLVITFA